MVTILDGYFEQGGQHVNLNVADLNDVYEKIMAGEDAIVRISGYCVNTKYLTKEQKTELINVSSTKFFQWTTTPLKFQVKLNQANTKGLTHVGPFYYAEKSSALSAVEG